jgi:hypothetical protein
MTGKDLRRLRQTRRLLVKRLSGFSDLLRGSVVLMKRPCTYPRCRKCQSGQRHPTWVLTFSRDGKTQSVYLGRKRLHHARRGVQDYHRLMELIEQLAQVNLAILRHPELLEKEPNNDHRGPAP